MVAFLLIPGLNSNARVYAGVLDALWPAGSVTIANHLAGGPIAELARAILAEAPPRFGLAGFSFGGYLAFEILRQAPARVERLALIDTAARADSAEAAENRRRRIELVRGGKFAVAVEQSFAASVHPDHETDAALLALHREMSLANGPDAYVRQQETILGRPDSRPGLAAIGVPTAIIVGAGDQITPVAAAEEMHQAIAGSRLVVVPQAGHLALVEQPAAVGSALAVWAQA